MDTVYIFIKEDREKRNRELIFYMSLTVIWNQNATKSEIPQLYFGQK